MKRENRAKRNRKAKASPPGSRKPAVILGAVLVFLMLLGGILIGGAPSASAMQDTTIVWISDQEANTILQVLPLTKNGSVQSPLVVYDSSSEEEIKNFISQLDPAPSQVRIVESVAFNIPESFSSEIETNTGVSVVRMEPADEYSYNSWVNRSGYPYYVVVSEDEEFMPYGSVYAHRTSSAFVNTHEEAQRIVRNDSDVTGVVYFGSDNVMETNLSELAETYGKSFYWLNTLESAMTMLTPEYTAETENIVTVIHADDNGSQSSDRQFWKLAPIYAAMRNTMLVTVEGLTIENVDASVDAVLDDIILPNNDGIEPGYLVFVGHWMVLPYRFLDARFPYQVSADARYADRDEDGDYVPDIPYGRITAYGLGNTALLINKGVFFDSGRMIRGDGAVLATDWTVELEEVTVTALTSIYGAENVYAKGDVSFSNSLTYNPSRTEVLNEARSADVVIFQGHGNPNYMSSTNPTLRGQYITAGRYYTPSLWWFSACDTGSYYPYSNSLVGAAIKSNAVNVVATVDTAATRSTSLEWYFGHLADGNDIGSTFQKGLKSCEASYSGPSVNKFAQLYLIGDPLVNYPSYVSEIPNRAPLIPSIPSGPGSAIAGIEYGYSSQTIDPDGDQLAYTFDWGDGTASTTLTVGSGQTGAAAHSWDEEGIYNVRVQATDSKGAVSGWSAIHVLNVEGTNSAPALDPIGDKEASEGNLLQFTIFGDDPNGMDDLSYSISNIPEGADFNSDTGLFAWTPGYDQAGQYNNIVFTTSDGQLTDSEMITINVLNVNRSPETPNVPAGPQTGLIDVSYEYTTSTVDPDSDKVTYTFDWGDGSTSTTGIVASGQKSVASHSWQVEGSYSVTVKATDSAGAYSQWSLPMSVTVRIPINPWRDNNSDGVHVNRDWDYTLGYKFSPVVNGKITELGGLFDGTKVVNLWDNQGNMLASESVASSNSWNYVALSEPVDVIRGQSYRVAVYTAGTGASYDKYISELPRTYGDITIESSCYGIGETYPASEATRFMFGMADVGFIAD